MKIRLWQPELFHTDGQTDRHDEANSRFSQFTNAPKKVVKVYQRLKRKYFKFTTKRHFRSNASSYNQLSVNCAMCSGRRRNMADVCRAQYNIQKLPVTDSTLLPCEHL